MKLIFNGIFTFLLLIILVGCTTKQSTVNKDKYSVEKTSVLEKDCNNTLREKKLNSNNVSEKCIKLAYRYKSLNKSIKASWYFLLSGKLDEVLKFSKEDVVTNPSNIGHAYILTNDFKKAKEFYRLMIENFNQPDHSIQSDFKLLKRLFPDKNNEIDYGIKVWNELYKPLLKTNKLYEKYQLSKKSNTHKEAIGYLNRIIKIKESYLKTNTLSISGDYLQLAYRYYNLNQPKKSIEILVRHIDIIERMNKNNGKNIGTYYKNFLAIYKKMDNSKEASKIFSSYADELLLEKEYEKALRFYILSGDIKKIKEIKTKIPSFDDEKDLYFAYFEMTKNYKKRGQTIAPRYIKDIFLEKYLEKSYDLRKKKFETEIITLGIGSPVNFINKEFSYSSKVSLKYNLKKYEGFASSGNKIAQRKLARFYWKKLQDDTKIFTNEILFSSFTQKAIYWNKLLAEEGRFRSMKILAEIYTTDKYNNLDNEKASYWIESMIKKRGVKKLPYDLKKKLYELSENGYIKDPKILYIVATSTYGDKAEKIYLKAAVLGDFLSQVKIAEKYYKKYTIEGFKESLFWYKKAQDNKKEGSECTYCQTYIDELSVLTNGSKDKNLIVRLAREYSRSYNKNKKNIGIELYQKLLKMGYKVYSYDLALIYQKTKDKKELSIKYFKIAADNEDSRACFALAKVYSDKGDKKKELYWNKKGYNYQAKDEIEKNKIYNAIHNRNSTLVKSVPRESKFLFDYICESTKDGSLDYIKVLYKKNEEIDLSSTCPKNGYSEDDILSPMQIASKYGYTSIVEYLLKINTRLQGGKYSSLHYSLSNGNTEISKLLIKKHSTKEVFKSAIYNDFNHLLDIPINSFSIEDTIKESSFNQFKKTVDNYSKKTIFLTNKTTKTPLFLVKYLEYLKKNNIEVKNISSLFFDAIFYHDIELINFFLDNNFSVDSFYENGSSYFSLLIKKEYDIELIEKVLRQSNNPLKLIKSIFREWYPRINRPEVMDLFLKFGLNPNYSEIIVDIASNRKNYVDLVSSTSNIEVIKFLLKRGTKIASKSIIFDNVINLNDRNEEIISDIEFLLENGANINESSSKVLSSLLHKAMQNNSEKRLELASFLIDKGINIENIDNSGKTLLQKKIIDQDKKSVIFLLSKGAKLSTEELNLCIKYGYHDLFRILLEYYQDNSNYKKLLLNSVQHASFDISQDLLNKGIKLDLSEEISQNIIFYARKNKLPNIYKNLDIKSVERAIENYNIRVNKKTVNKKKKIISKVIIEKDHKITKKNNTEIPLWLKGSFSE